MSRSRHRISRAYLDMNSLLNSILSSISLLALSGAHVGAQTLYAPGGIVGNSGNANVGIGGSNPAGRLDITDVEGDRAILGYSAGVANRFDLMILDTPASPKTLLLWGGNASNGYRMGQFQVNATSIFLNSSAAVSINGAVQTNMGEGFKIFGDTNYFGTGNDGVVFEMQDINGPQGFTDGGFVWRGYTTSDAIPRDWMVIRSPGVVGVGTNAPAAMLDVNTANFTMGAGSAAIRIIGHSNKERVGIESSTPVFQAGKFNGSTISRGAVLAGDHLGYFQAGGFDGTAQRFNQGRMVIVADENHSSTAQGTRIEFQTTPSGSTAVGTRMTVKGNGNVGIGTCSPSWRLDVYGGSAFGGLNLDPAFGGAGYLTALANSGKLLIGANRSGGWGEADFIANRGGGSAGGFAFYDYSNGGVLTNLLLIRGDGNVGVGTLNPTERLSVNGKVRAKEVVVETTGWSDYVFADDYELAPLNEIEAHIREHRHLPGIPSAKEVAEQGLSVGEMQAKLLAKLEEVTLHLIRMEKENLAQAKEITRLKAKQDASETAHSR